MNNVVRFPAPEEDRANFGEFLDRLKEEADQIVYVQVTKDGKLGLGHSPLEYRDLLLMYHYIQNYLQRLVNNPEEF